VCVYLCLRSSRGLATSWSPAQGVLPTVQDLVTEVKRKVSWRRPRPELGCRAKRKKYGTRKIYMYRPGVVTATLPLPLCAYVSPLYSWMSTCTKSMKFTRLWDYLYEAISSLVPSNINAYCSESSSNSHTSTCHLRGFSAGNVNEVQSMLRTNVQTRPNSQVCDRLTLLNPVPFTIPFIREILM
jgi:hypothetical protein